MRDTFCTNLESGISALHSRASSGIFLRLPHTVTQGRQLAHVCAVSIDVAVLTLLCSALGFAGIWLWDFFSLYPLPWYLLKRFQCYGLVKFVNMILRFVRKV